MDPLISEMSHIKKPLVKKSYFMFPFNKLIKHIENTMYWNFIISIKLFYTGFLCLCSICKTLKFKCIGWVNHLFTSDLVLKSFIQATRCFLQILKIQSNFWDIGNQSQWPQQVSYRRHKLKLHISWNH